MTPPNPELEYAIWTIPGTDFTVQYSLAAFHEIDFQVNEGYRSIPHGGIEIGGLLFGRVDQRSASIEAFRIIECEHVAGPSFNLSDRDLSKLDQQIEASKTDPDLKDLVVVGWFIAHTRSPLRMGEKEAALFSRYFPDPGKIAVLIKPERFQPTRFGFLVREANGQIKTDASEQAIILPLSGRGSGVRSGSGPIPSIAAPVRPEPTAKPAATTKPAVPAKPARDRGPQVPETSSAQPQPRTEPTTRTQPAPRDVPVAPPDLQPIAPPPKLEPQIEPDRIPQRSRLWTPGPVPSNGGETHKPPTETRPFRPHPEPQDLGQKDTSGPAHIEPPATETRPTRIAPQPSPAGPDHEVDPPGNSTATPATPLPSLEEIRKRRASDSPPVAHEERPRSRRTQPLLSEPKIWNLRLTAVLILAAALGCGVGYLGYLQLPSAIIPLKVRKRPSTLIVSWPPEQTRDAVYASIRVDDGQPMALTTEEKASGVTEVKSGAGNIKIELISKHWMRDSRGIVRYIKALTPASSPPGKVSPDRTNLGR